MKTMTLQAACYLLSICFETHFPYLFGTFRRLSLSMMPFYCYFLQVDKIFLLSIMSDTVAVHFGSTLKVCFLHHLSERKQVFLVAERLVMHIIWSHLMYCKLILVLKKEKKCVLSGKFSCLYIFPVGVILTCLDSA